MRPSASMKHPNSIKKLTKLTNVNEEKKTGSIFTRGQPSEKNYFFGVAVDRGFQQLNNIYQEILPLCTKVDNNKDT